MREDPNGKEKNIIKIVYKNCMPFHALGSRPRKRISVWLLAGAKKPKRDFSRASGQRRVSRERV